MKNKNIYPWLVVAMLWGVALLNYMDRQMLSTMKSAMQIDIVELESATNFGRLMAVFLWIYGLMSPISGIIAWPSCVPRCYFSPTVVSAAILAA